MQKIMSVKEKMLLALHFVLIVTIAVFQTVYPVYVSSFINRQTPAYGILGVITFLILGKVIIHIIDTVLNSKIYWSVFSRLRLKLTDALLDMDYAEIIRKDMGELTQTIENDSKQLVQFYLVFISTLIKNLLFVLGILIVGIIADIRIGILLVFILITLFFVFRKINRIAKGRWENTKNEYQKFFTLFSKLHMMMDEMTLLHQENYLNQLLAKTMKKVFDADFLSSLISYQLWISTILGFGIVKIFVLLLGVFANMDMGLVYLFIYYLDLLNDPVEELRIQLENIPSTLEASKRVGQLLETKTSMLYGTRELEEKITNISFIQAGFSYDKKCIFKDFNICFEAGKIYGLIGKSGSGKSTLINLLARLYDVNSGRIEVNKIPISDLKKGELSRQIEYIGQNEQAELTNKEMLSKGQKQYLSLLKALSSDKQVLMLDEIFTHIDAEKVKSAFKTFAKKKQIIIVITHEKEVMKFCDQLIDLEEDSYAV